MLDDIQVGQNIQVKVVKTPTNAAARKTIVRVLNKDPEAQQRAQTQRDIRDLHNKPTARGGREWISRIPVQPASKAETGETGTLRATYDVLRDLKSVERFVEVQAA